MAKGKRTTNNFGATFESAAQRGNFNTGFAAKKYDFGVGIDVGTNTGFAIFNFEQKELTEVKTTTFTEATNTILNFKQLELNFFVRFEDARQRVWFGNKGKESLQGAGSIKRECNIWEEFLTFHKIPFECVAPKNNITKTKQDFFKQLTKWQGTTNEHGRDAAMLVFQKPKFL